MGLRLKFNLILFVAIALGLTIAGAFSDKLLKDNAREEVLQSARIMMESAIAVRNYTVKEVKPLLAVQQRRQFISQTVPAYAASQYIKRLQEKHPEYSYKEATLNPTNPANRATQWENDIVSYFRNHDAKKELIGERDTPTGRQLYLSRPIKITNPGCLACHSTPANAPETLINTYGDNNGFGWKLNEIVGAQIVSVPMSLPLQRANMTFMTFMAGLVGVFALLFIVLNIMLHYIILKPVTAMSKKADEVSLGNLAVAELTVTGNDEISSLGRSFNRMHRSLDNAVKLLDETIDEE
ncbi:MAG: signal protein [Moraxellaceae bacterium]|nr:MAG: signal protein [Moraxellaceae bacterium]